MPSLIPVVQPDTKPYHDHPRPERQVLGNPKRSTWELYNNPSGQVSSGIWACEPGAWRIVFDEHSDEYFHVLEGRIRISDQSGKALEFGPGDACIIPAGFSGTFEVLEQVRKNYVLIKRQS